jgi:hypothetical protein
MRENWENIEAELRSKNYKPVQCGGREPFFSEKSYGFRPMRSAHDAVSAAQELIKQSKRYVLDIDPEVVFRSPSGGACAGQCNGMD